MLRNLFFPAQFTGRHMIGVMALFFGTIISVNLTLAWFASTTWSGLVVENSYVASQHFNELTAERTVQAGRGWTASTHYADGIFQVDLQDSGARPVSGVVVAAMIGRPATESADRTLRLEPLRSGGYGAPTDLAPGIWEAQLRVEAQGRQPWQHAIRFVVK
ncbi:FixH family protein [Aurantimonas sp. A2-1-M11]|uniref:FixH family protein n=1 Tax=Aurantimonas sp. A2-1-M11 TaxID=3113712 RepID=UPI002F94B0DF